MHRFLPVLILLVAGCTRPPESELPAILLDDRFARQSKGWREYASGSKHPAGSTKWSDLGLLLDTRTKGVHGLYHDEWFGGNFDVQLDLGAGEGTSGLLLFKEKWGIPDPDNYVGLEVDTNKAGRTTVRVVGRRDGQDLVRDSNRWRAKFAYRLTNETFGREPKALRVVRDARAECLHFYYKYDRPVDGRPMEGWMEFSTLPDWKPDRFLLCSYVKSDGQLPASRNFTRAIIRRTRSTDLSDRETGFAATRRDYTFSGFTGDAVVVTFDGIFPYHKNAKFVFWDEANYIPWWHIDSKCAVVYGFCETWEGGTIGCCEPMSDRLRRWSKVDILEANAARVIVHWEYVLADPDYHWWGRSPEEKPRVDEWYCFYPDGGGVRKVTYTPSLRSKHKMNWNEISELEVVTPGGTKPSEVIQDFAITMLNLKGMRLDFLWDLSRKKEPAKMDESVKFWEEAICRVNLRDRPAAFAVFAQGKTASETFPHPYGKWWANYGANWAFELRGGYEFEGDFWTFSHWPISKIPYDEPVKTNGKYVREPAHTSLLPVAGAPEVKGPTTWAFLIGLSRPNDDQGLRDRAAAWMDPGKIQMLSQSSRFVKNDLYERALVFENVGRDQQCHFEITPATVSARVGYPVFKIRGWGDHPLAVTWDGRRLQEGNDFRYAIVEGDALIWINGTLDAEARFAVVAKPVNEPAGRK